MVIFASGGITGKIYLENVAKGFSLPLIVET